MLRILGSRKKFCAGPTRRDMLRAGSLGLAGLRLEDLLRSSAVAAPPADERLRRSFGKAKSCILLFLYGSPSQLETFDTKPEAPLEIRGELGVIPSSVPGLNVGELLPHTAKITDRVTVLRSVTHPYPVHGVAYATTGIPTITVPMELSPRHEGHWPFFGSVVDYVDQQGSTGSAPPLPRNIGLPWPMSTRRSGEVHRAGPYAAFLGSAYNPVWTEFEGTGNKPILRTLRDETVEIMDPYSGIEPDCRFPISAAGSLPAEMTLDRLDRRRSLLEQFEDQRRDSESQAAAAGFDRYREMAFSLLTSQRLRNALDLQREPMKVREGYGMSVFGQASLVARRLVEAGGRIVTVFWDEYGLAGSGWDTHWNHFYRMKENLMPSFDIAFAGLIRDLEVRGMLDETLVLCISEHGRTPRINKAKGGGRDHWSRAYSAVFAGAGMGRGNIVGRTDRIASDVIDNPVSPKDILATAYHLLGIDPNATIRDRLGRALPLAGPGVVRPELLA